LSDAEKEAVLDQIEVDEETVEELADAVEESEDNEEAEGLQAQLDEAKEQLAEARAALAESETKLVEARTYFEQVTCNQQTQISDLTSQIETMRTSMFAEIQAMMMPMFMNMMAMMQDSQLTQRMEQGLAGPQSSGNNVASSLGLNLLSLADIYSANGGRGGITINNYSVGGSYIGGDYANSLTRSQAPGSMGSLMMGPRGFNFTDNSQNFRQMDAQNRAMPNNGPMNIDPRLVPGQAPVQAPAPVLQGPAPAAQAPAPAAPAGIPASPNMV
jgi:hypothetical protein